ncbi:MAG: FAD:protein FMN transferase [Firmicutes bacterium]|nr:FAD:protein FMN transferase [Bacillota bacterium]
MNITAPDKGDKTDIKVNRPGILITAISLILLTLGLYFSYKNHTAKPFLHEAHFTKFFMDTYIEINVLDKDEKKAEKAAEEAFAVFAELDKKYNYYDKNSYLSRINNNEIKEIDDPETAFLIKKGIEFSEKSNGAFDMTLGAVKDLYPFGKKDPIPPERKKIEEALAVSGYKKVRFEGNKLTKPESLKLDPGGILKGYAVDKAIELLRKNGIENALVNAGGNIGVLGSNPKGKPWKIGVENPRTQGEVIAVISLVNKAVATSGDYQRYFFYNGKRYHHILDPSTGEPADKTYGATVTAPDAITTDAYSTAVFVMGKKKGMEFLKKEKLEGIIIDKDGTESNISN